MQKQNPNIFWDVIIGSVLERADDVSLVAGCGQKNNGGRCLFCGGYPNIFFKSASGVEIGVRLNFSTRTFKMLGDMNAGRLGPM